MQFEYRVEDFMGTWGDEEIQQELNQIGAEGWELVAVILINKTRCFFKRQKG